MCKMAEERTSGNETIRDLIKSASELMTAHERSLEN